jgi:hypothetical protein
MGEVTELVGPSGSLKSQVCAHATAYQSLLGGQVHVITSKADGTPKRLRGLLRAVSTMELSARGHSSGAARAAAGTAAGRIHLHQCFSLAQLHSSLTSLLAGPSSQRAAVALRAASVEVTQPVGAKPSTALQAGSTSTPEKRSRDPSPTAVRQPNSSARNDAATMPDDGTETATKTRQPPARLALVVVDSLHAIAAASVGSLRPPKPATSASYSSSSSSSSSSVAAAEKGEQDGFAMGGGSFRHAHGAGSSSSSGSVLGTMSSALLEAIGRQLRQIARVCGCCVLVTNGAVPAGQRASGDLQPALGSAWYGVSDNCVALWPSNPASAGSSRGEGVSDGAAADHLPGGASIRDRSRPRMPLFQQQTSAARVRLLRAPRERFACMASGSHTSVVAAPPAATLEPTQPATPADEFNEDGEPARHVKKRVDLAFRWCDTGLVMREGVFDPPSLLSKPMAARLVAAATGATAREAAPRAGPIGSALVPDSASRAAVAAQAAVQALMERDHYGESEDAAVTAADVLASDGAGPLRWSHMAGYAATAAALSGAACSQADLVSTAVRCGRAGEFLAGTASQGWDVDDGEVFVGGSASVVRED